MLFSYLRLYTIALACLFVATGCATNPVTGKSELSLVSTQQELTIGQQQYSPSQQAQGGLYTLDPQLGDYVSQIGHHLAKLSDRPALPYEFVVLNNSTPNAWALPGGKIAINRGLLLLLEDEAQLAAVLSHEIVHAAARHGASQLSQRTLLQLGTQIIGQATQSNGYARLADLGAHALHARYGRSQELEADHYGIRYMVKAGYDPQAAVELQQTFLRLSKGRGGHWLETLFASHPPSAERVSKNQAQARLFKQGKRNTTAYQKAIAQLRQDKAAYQLHDQALAAAQKKQWQKAKQLTAKAIKQQPREALFYITQGRLQQQNKQHKAAIASFNQAITYNPNYFAGFLYQGLSYYDTKQYQQAKQSLTRANQQLNTGLGNYYLGEASLKMGQKSSAINYYQKALHSGGEIAKAAAARLQVLRSP